MEGLGGEWYWSASCKIPKELIKNCVKRVSTNDTAI